MMMNLVGSSMQGTRTPNADIQSRHNNDNHDLTTYEIDNTESGTPPPSRRLKYVVIFTLETSYEYIKAHDWITAFARNDTNMKKKIQLSHKAARTHHQSSRAYCHTKQKDEKFSPRGVVSSRGWRSLSEVRLLSGSGSSERVVSDIKTLQILLICKLNLGLSVQTILANRIEFDS